MPTLESHSSVIKCLWTTSHVNGRTARRWPCNGDSKSSIGDRNARHALRAQTNKGYDSSWAGPAKRCDPRLPRGEAERYSGFGDSVVTTTMNYATCIPRTKLRSGFQMFCRLINLPTTHINICNNRNKCLPTKYGDYTAQFLAAVKSFNLQRLLTCTTRFIFAGRKTAGAWCWQPTPTYVRVRVELHLCSAPRPSWSVPRLTLPTGIIVTISTPCPQTVFT